MKKLKEPIRVTNLVLTERIFKAVKELSKTTKQSMSVTVRDILKKFFKIND